MLLGCQGSRDIFCCKWTVASRVEAANWLQADISSPRSYCCLGNAPCLLNWISCQLLKQVIHWKTYISSLKNQKNWQCWSNFFFFFSLFSKNLELSNSLSLDVVCAISLDHPNFLLSAKPAYLILVPDLSLQVTEFATPDTDNWTTWSPAHFICDDKMVQGTPRSQWVKYFNKVSLHTLKTKVCSKNTHTHIINTINYIS